MKPRIHLRPDLFKVHERSSVKVRERLYTLECYGVLHDAVFFQPDKVFKPNRIVCWGGKPCGLTSLRIGPEEQMSPLDPGMAHDMQPFLSPYTLEEARLLVARNLFNDALIQKGMPHLYFRTVELQHRVTFSGIYGLETIGLLGVEPEGDSL